MKVELKDVDELELISFMDDLASIEGLSCIQVAQINDAISKRFGTMVHIARHYPESEWEVWTY